MIKSIRTAIFFYILILSESHIGTSQTQFPAGFSQVKISNVYYPTAMAPLPDGRILVTEKAGRVKVIKNGVVLSTPFLQVAVEETNERGLCGIAIDPDFAVNKYVYIYYTVASSPIHNRLSRFVANGDVALANSETILLDFEPVVNSIHNGGGMAFGPDGKLYLAMGDDKVSTNAQSMSTHKGKILRINKDGSTPSGNPFSGSAIASRIWATGFRNPYSISIQPGTGRIFVNDVGEGQWEEVNDATVAGKNFGWPGTEGYTSNPAYQTPFYAYPHTGSANFSGCAVSGGAFFSPSQTNYPPQYTGKYFFLDYCNDWINYIDPAGGTPQNFASVISGAPVYMITGADGNLYYLSINQSSLFRITYSGSAAPAISQQPSSQTVSAGQPVTFNVSATGTSPLTYQWYKNNVMIQGANAAAFSIASAQTSDQGSYRVTVSNSAGTASSTAASLSVTAFNNAPFAMINTPTQGMLYRGGDVISYSGSGSDAEDGTLAASNFSWMVEFHHDTHHHPGPALTNGSASGSFAIPQTGESSANVFYRLILTVKDSNGRTDTAYTDVHPHTSSVSFKTTPPGLQVSFEGQPSVTTYSVLAVENMKFTIDAVSPQVLNGTNYVFSHWEHGGGKAQEISIAQNNATLTAVYTAAGQASCTASGTILREYWSGVNSNNLSEVPFQSAPSGSSQLTKFEAPQLFGDYYGSRISGYICPPATGNYTFWIAADNSAELWISTDDNPLNKSKKAETSYTSPNEWTKYPSQKSGPVYLVAGQRYYIEAIHRERDQGDHLSVGWQIPGGAIERPIPGNRLSPYLKNLAVSLTSPDNNSTHGAGTTITLSATATGPDPVSKVEFFAGTNKIGEDLSAPYDLAWNNVAAGIYNLTAKATDSKQQTVTSAAVQITVTASLACNASGFCKREIWYNVTGSGVSSIPLSSPPDVSDQLQQFKAISNIGDNYGQRLSGYLCPPATGQYTFWISSDNNSELWLSTDENQASRQKIAYVTGWTMSQEYTKYATQQSAPITLQAGKTYYLEALHKEGTEGDNLSVGWALPGGTLERPIPGSRLSPTLSSQPSALSVTLTAPADNSTHQTGSSIPMSAQVSGNTGVNKVEFYNGSVKLAEDNAAPFSYTWTNVQSGNYTLTARATDANLQTYTSPPVKISVVTGAVCTGTGQISREVWYNVMGTALNTIPLNTPPQTTEQLLNFEAPSNVDDNYGQRIRGYICPPITGAYRFYIASDDNSELYLSMSDDPAGKQKIASVSGWTFPNEYEKYPSQISATINLTAGQKYYIEALHKEGTQGDNLSVGWQLPGGSMERPMPGSRLIPFLEAAPPSACEAFIQPNGPTTFCQGGSVTLFSNTGSNFSYQWIKNGNVIPTATASAYYTNEAGSYQVRISYPGCIAYSAPTYVTINSELTSQITPGGPTTFCEGEQLVLYGNVCDGYIYQWKKDGADIPGANASTYTATQSGSYQLKIAYQSSMNWSALINVTVNDCGGAQARVSQQDSTYVSQEESAFRGESDPQVQPKAPAEEFKVKVFPNPTTGMFTFDFCLEESEEDILQIAVISASSGQTVYNKPAEKVNGCVKGNIELSSSLPVGIYILRIRIGNRVESTKLILYR